MTMPPPMPMEQALAQHGDIFYRIALLLAGDAERAASAMRVAMRRAAQAEPPVFGSDAVLRVLLQVLEQQTGQRRRRRARRYGPGAELYGGPAVFSPFDSLPFAQRAALGLHLLLGYDLPTVAAITGVSEDVAGETVAAATEGLAAATGTVLPDAKPTDLCPTVRSAVMRIPEQLTSDPMLRGHLALCSACRAFETAWSELTRRIESTLRGALRPYMLPADLAALLIRDAQPKTRLLARVMAGGRLGFTLVPLGVLLLIAALVLPGFWRSDTATQLRADAPLAEPRGLVQQALTQVTHPPAGKGVWHAQWETLWFFPDGKYAPLYADAWLDSYNPARHRLQLVHGAGGALYELQVGDGDRELWYALSQTYYSSLYGTNFDTPEEPQLVHRSMDAATQKSAVAARLGAGAWDVGPSYLRQAYRAPDLRTLGRQLDGTHAVQILSFTGISPLGLPPDDPQVSLKDVTVLLALDSADGRLRSVTELSGPPGGEQTSRVTWHLRSEEWLANETQARAAFDAERAWNGRGTFSTEVQGTSADSTLLLYDQGNSVPLEWLFNVSLPLPATPPPAVERALLYNKEDPARAGVWPPTVSLTYLGQGRRLTLTWRDRQQNRVSGQDLPNGENINVSRGQHYVLKVPIFDQSISPLDVVIDSSGYTRAELLAVAQSLRPLDMNTWRAQKQLFPTPEAVAPQAQAAIVAALAHAAPPGPNELLHWRESHYVHHDAPTAVPADPYHLPAYGGWPETTLDEQWVRADDRPGTFAKFTQIVQGDGLVYATIYSDHGSRWMYKSSNSVLERWRWPIYDANAWMGTGTTAALDILAHPGEGVKLTTTADGTRVISRIEPIEQSSRYGWLASVNPDLQNQTDQIVTLEPITAQIATFPHISFPTLPIVRPLQILTELEIAPTGEINHLRYTAIGPKGGNDRTLLEEWSLEQEQRLASDAAPPDLQGTPPSDVTFVDDYNADQVLNMTSSATITEARTLAQSPLLVLPEGGPSKLSLIEMRTDKLDTQSDPPRDVLEEAVMRGLAIRLRYDNTVGDPTMLLLVQGPVAPLRAFLQSRPAPWQRSIQRRVVIAGREVNAWLMVMSGYEPHAWLVAEIDGTLIIANGDEPWFSARAVPQLASLQRAN